MNYCAVCGSLLNDKNKSKNKNCFCGKFNSEIFKDITYNQVTYIEDLCKKLNLNTKDYINSKTTKFEAIEIINKLKEMEKADEAD